MSSSPVPCIFVVDDEYVIASTLAAILKMNGFSAKFFTCPLEALTAAESNTPDLLISDVAMPGISGIELAIQMRAQFPMCKMLLFSGQATTQDLLRDARSQGHDFQLLQKPVHPSEMLSRIAVLMTESILTGSETSTSRLRREADAARESGKQLLKDSLSTPDALRYERISRDAVSLLVKAARLRNHADALEKDGPSN
jgi:DNA-binding response OmpR family regulator